MNCFWGREDKDKGRQENGQFILFYFFKIDLFEHILKKSAQSLFDAWSFLLVHIGLTPSEGPKNFVD